MKVSEDAVTTHKMDESTLRRLYLDEGLSQRQIADELGKTRSQVRKKIEKYKIPTRPSGGQWKNIKWDGSSWVTESCHSKLHTGGNGYEMWCPKVNGKIKTFYHHRLLAIAKFGVSEVKGKEVHHKSGVPWDNRKENLEIMTPSKHAAHHSRQRGNN